MNIDFIPFPGTIILVSYVFRFILALGSMGVGGYLLIEYFKNGAGLFGTGSPYALLGFCLCIMGLFLFFPPIFTISF